MSVFRGDPPNLKNLKNQDKYSSRTLVREAVQIKIAEVWFSTKVFDLMVIIYHCLTLKDQKNKEGKQ